MRIAILTSIAMTMVMASCSNPYKYFGKTYAETENPEIFFRSEDVPQEYEEMGKLEVELPASKKMEKIQNKVVQIAGKHGADAVMIDNFDMETGAFTTVSSRGGKKNEDGSKYDVGAQKTEVEKDIAVKATLLKFEKNIDRTE